MKTKNLIIENIGLRKINSYGECVTWDYLFKIYNNIVDVRDGLKIKYLKSKTELRPIM